MIEPEASDQEPRPRLLVSSVIRATDKGESHGGAYLVDTATGTSEPVLDWNDPTIDWAGRGGDRGLRGIAFHDGLVYMAASDEIFVFDRSFERRGSHRNPFLKHCHEIWIEDGILHATSTGFDSVLSLDLAAGRWIAGYAVRFAQVGGRRLMPRRLRRRFARPQNPLFHPFDPESGRGPNPGDTTHLNSVTAAGGRIYVSGRAMGRLVAIEDGRMTTFAEIPYGTHNARPFREGVLLNHTSTDTVSYVDRAGAVLRSWPVVRYDQAQLQHAGLSEDLARQAFGRGLAVIDDDTFAAGSSPATVTLYRFDTPEPVLHVTLSMDMRNAIHGLEVWPD